MPIARVFVRRTSATPDDDYSFVGFPPMREFLPEDITEVHVSVVFTWDKPMAEQLASAWSSIAPVKIGGPAYDARGGVFVRGMYTKAGHVITSRGCNNHCWFCLVPHREGILRELDIVEGNNVLDNNLLQCSEQHIFNVFEMLKTQPDAKFTGGLEAKLLRPWHVELMTECKIREAFFAYDTKDDLGPFIEAMSIINASEWHGKARCYVLCGYEGDTTERANARCVDVLRQGAIPFAMFYRDTEGKNVKDVDWRKFQRCWTRPAAINAERKRLGIAEARKGKGAQDNDKF